LKPEPPQPSQPKLSGRDQSKEIAQLKDQIERLTKERNMFAQKVIDIE
jgi:hypothetical protein